MKIKWPPKRGEAVIRKISKEEDRLIHRMNKLAKIMDEWCLSTHPSAWDDLTKEMVAEWKRLNRKLNSI